MSSLKKLLFISSPHWFALFLTFQRMHISKFQVLYAIFLLFLFSVTETLVHPWLRMLAWISLWELWGLDMLFHMSDQFWIRWDQGQAHIFPCRQPVVLAPFVQKSFLPHTWLLWCIYWTLWLVPMQVYSWNSSFCSIYLPWDCLSSTIKCVWSTDMSDHTESLPVPHILKVIYIYIYFKGHAVITYNSCLNLTI